MTTTTERLDKRLTRAGVCSRRDVKKLVAEGRVTVDGRPASEAGQPVGPEDDIRVDGTKLRPTEPTRMWRLFKKRGLVTSHRDEKGRPTVFERLPKGMGRVISVGRLDLNTEGLLLLTNDGELARHLELPGTGWKRRYRVRVHGKVDPDRLTKLAQGVTVDGVRYGPIEAALDRQQGTNAWLTVSLQEGKNREIRKVMAHLGLQVTRLMRLSYGPFQLGSLAPGEVEEVAPKVLRDQLGATRIRKGG